MTRPPILSAGAADTRTATGYDSSSSTVVWALVSSTITAIATLFQRFLRSCSFMSALYRMLVPKPQFVRSQAKKKRFHVHMSTLSIADSSSATFDPFKTKICNGHLPQPTPTQEVVTLNLLSSFQTMFNSNPNQLLSRRPLGVTEVTQTILTLSLTSRHHAAEQRNAAAT